MARMLGLAAALLALSAPASPALAQSAPPLPATRDYSATYRVSGLNDQTVDVKVFWNAALKRQRVEPQLPDAPAGMGGIAMIMDQGAGTITMLQPSQRMAMELPIGAQGGASGPDMQSMIDTNKYRFERTGSDRVLNQPCTVWRVVEKAGAGAGTACITSDGVMLRTEANHQGRPTRMEAVAVSLTTQPATLFEVPADYQRMQMPGAGQGQRPPRRQ
jgi:hypothetical protein